jgi:hypothetical protein
MRHAALIADVNAMRWTSRCVDPRHPTSRPHGHPIGLERSVDQRGVLGRFAAEQRGACLHERDLCAEPLEGLREFTADRTAADHE